MIASSELIHFAAAVIHYEGGVEELTRFVFNLPSHSALYKQAAHDLLHNLKGAST